ncbi:Ribosomal protein lysine methyltransferase, partial [Oleoguttula sp. CCFEE 5521]
SIHSSRHKSSQQSRTRREKDRESAMDAFLALLGDEIQDSSEETFTLFSQSHSTQDLGMLDPTAASVDITIGSRDFTITQSPGLLQSSREGGTTGAAVWRTSIFLAKWLDSTNNPLFAQGIIDASSTMMELGSGISGLTAGVLAPKIARVVATDQSYALKLLRQNIDSNQPTSRKKSAVPACQIDTLSLDWEQDDVPSFLSLHNLAIGVDILLASDCVYNYALIEPFVNVCAEICRIRKGTEHNGEQAERPTLCIIAQQLRQPDVFEQWLEGFMGRFRVWRVPDDSLGRDVDKGSGFCIHVGVLR